MENTIKNRIDFIFAFDVQDGNPNGDPDAGNMPRIDIETGQGLVTDVCLKRKVRNYVQVKKNCSDGFDIFIKEKAVLNSLIGDACEKAGYEEPKKKEKNNTKHVDPARSIMCEKYYDVRTFGAVMTTGKNAGQVRGPIQLTFARSVDPINSTDHSITRMAETEDNGVGQTMGRKATVSYGLYVCHGFISAKLAEQTKFSNDDLELFWEALKNMFDCDRSASHGLMSARKLIVFKHESEYGNEPANKLFDLVKFSKKCQDVPRSFEDYEVKIDEDKRPEDVEIIELI